MPTPTQRPFVGMSVCQSVAYQRHMQSAWVPLYSGITLTIWFSLWPGFCVFLCPFERRAGSGCLHCFDSGLLFLNGCLAFWLLIKFACCPLARWLVGQLKLKTRIELARNFKGATCLDLAASKTITFMKLSANIRVGLTAAPTKTTSRTKKKLVIFSE